MGHGIPKKPDGHMPVIAREMELSEVELIISYFHEATPEHLDLLGVDPTRLPHPDLWRQFYEAEYAMARPQRSTMLVLWERDGLPLGFSTADKIVFGREAHMHLHIPDSGQRRSGLAAECVRLTAALYFETLGAERLLCEPNAFNVAPSRTLQRAGFTYEKTHLTVPGPLNYHQPVTRWVLKRPR